MLPTTPSPLATRLRAPGYLLLGLMAVLPLIDMLVLGWPAHPEQVAWRFGIFGQLSAGASAPLIGLLLLYALSYATADRRMLYVWGTVAGIYALFLLAAVGSFPLDALEMRRRVPPAAQSKFTVATAAAVFRLALYALGAIALTVSQFRAARLMSAMLAARPDHPASSLVMRNLSGPSRPTPSTTAAQLPDASAPPPGRISPEE